MKILLSLLSTVMILAISSVPMAQVSSDALDLDKEQRRFMVGVTNSDGNWITGLTAAHFDVFEKKNRREIAVFSSQDEAASVGILIDRSGSMAAIKASVIVEAVEAFIRKGNSNSEYFVVAFDESPRLRLDFEQDKVKVTSSIRDLISLQPKGNTKLWEAVRFGYDKILDGKYRKKALVLISDLGDTESKTDFRNLVKLAKSTNVIFYALPLMNGKDAASMVGMQNQAFVDDLVEFSGGRAFYAESDKQFIKFAFMIAEDIQNRYFIELQASDQDNKNTENVWHKIEFRLDRSRRPGQLKKARVIARQGYFSKPVVTK